MLKFNKRCTTCVAVKEDEKLLKEIFNSKFYVGRADAPSLQSIANKYKDKFSYVSLQNHVKRHQFMSETDFTKRRLQQVAKDAEKSIIRKTIESTDVFNEVIGKGMEALQNGELNIQTRDLLKAAELKKGFQLKEQDQQLAMMEMVFHFTSGEADNLKSRAYDRRTIEGEAVEHYDPADESTADIERRTAQSSSFYESLAGDAPSPGTN